MIIGYAMNCPDDDSCMLADPPSEGVTCASCGCVIDPGFVNQDYAPRNKTADLFTTWDGYFIASTRFKAFCDQQGYNHLTFRFLPKAGGFYALSIGTELQMDVTDEIKFEEYCEGCGTYQSVYGCSTIRLKEAAQALNDGVFRTNIRFGYKRMTFPIIIVGTLTRDKVKLHKLRGLTFESIESIESRKR